MFITLLITVGTFGDLSAYARGNLNAQLKRQELKVQKSKAAYDSKKFKKMPTWAPLISFFENQWRAHEIPTYTPPQMIPETPQDHPRRTTPSFNLPQIRSPLLATLLVFMVLNPTVTSSQHLPPEPPQNLVSSTAVSNCDETPAGAPLSAPNTDLVRLTVEASGQVQDAMASDLEKVQAFHTYLNTHPEIDARDPVLNKIVDEMSVERIVELFENDYIPKNVAKTLSLGSPEVRDYILSSKRVKNREKHAIDYYTKKLKKENIEIPPDEHLAEIVRSIPAFDTVTNIKKIQTTLNNRNFVYKVRTFDNQEYIVKVNGPAENANFQSMMAFYREYPALHEAASSQLASYLTGGHVPAGHVVGGQAVTYPYVDISKKLDAKILALKEKDGDKYQILDIHSALTSKQKAQLFVHMMTDYLLENVDTHYNQFGIDPEGNIVGVDKSIAFLEGANGIYTADKIGYPVRFGFAQFFNLSEKSIYYDFFKHLAQNKNALNEVLESQEARDFFSRLNALRREDIVDTLSPLLQFQMARLQELGQTSPNYIEIGQLTIAKFGKEHVSEVLGQAFGMTREQILQKVTDPHPPGFGSAMQGDPVFAAAKAGDLNRVKAEFKKDPKALTPLDPLGRNPLQTTLGLGSSDEVAQWMIQNMKTADLNTRDPFGDTPLHIAVTRGAELSTQELWKRLPKNARLATDLRGRNALHLAVYWGNGKAILFLLEQMTGDELMIPDAGGETVLSWAIASRNRDLITYLAAKVPHSKIPQDQIKKMNEILKS